MNGASFGSCRLFLASLPEPASPLARCPRPSSATRGTTQEGTVPMRNKLLFSTMALLAGVTLASAQQGGAPGGQPGGGMERQSPPQTQRAPEGRGKEQQGQQSQ